MDHLRCQPGFVLLFTTPLRQGFDGFGPIDGFSQLPDLARTTADLWRTAAEAHVLGTGFLATLTRR